MAEVKITHSFQYNTYLLWINDHALILGHKQAQEMIADCKMKKDMFGKNAEYTLPKKIKK